MSRFLALALLAAVIPQAALAQDDLARRIEAGRKTFAAVGCSGCHGFGGQGGIGPMTGPRIAGLPTAAIMAIVRRPPEPMPAFSKAQLPDAKVAEIGDYLHSLPQPRGADMIAILPQPKLTGDIVGGPGAKPRRR